MRLLEYGSIRYLLYNFQCDFVTFSLFCPRSINFGSSRVIEWAISKWTVFWKKLNGQLLFMIDLWNASPSSLAQNRPLSSTWAVYFRLPIWMHVPLQQLIAEQYSCSICLSYFHFHQFHFFLFDMVQILLSAIFSFRQMVALLSSCQSLFSFRVLNLTVTCVSSSWLCHIYI